MGPPEPVAPLEVGLRGGNTSREQLKCPFLGAASVRSLRSTPMLSSSAVCPWGGSSQLGLAAATRN